MSIKRRHFLQFAGSTLAAIGLSQFDFLHQAERYGRVLAQSTPRKLALLIGINGYQGVNSLNGCLTDVDLQKYLLIHRFGFNPNDILVVSDAVDNPYQPTRANILAAFEEHLIKQAKPGDVVVFHYSGHGDRIKDPTPLNTSECQAVNDCELNGTMVPMDAAVEQENNLEITVPDIMGRTLFLLMSAVNTDNFTAILDSCHSGAGTRGNVVVRAASRTRASEQQILIPSQQELNYQEQWLSRLDLSSARFQALRQTGVAKGTVLGSAQRNQLAVDAPFDGFSAGGFTYLLTRYLWQITGSPTADAVYTILKRSTNSLSEEKRRSAQVPVFEYAPNSNNAQKPLYFIAARPIAADAVITKVDNEQIEFWLGGVATQSLESDGKGNRYTLLNAEGNAVGEIEQIDRRGLYGYGKLISGEAKEVTADQLLRETVIGMPTELVLKIGIDPTLADEMPQASRALSEIRHIKAGPLNQTEAVDYVLGRWNDTDGQSAGEGPPVGSVGLFWQDQTVAIDRSFGRPDESAMAAVERLQPLLKMLLAGKLLQAIASATSELQITGEIYAASGEGPRIQISSRGAETNRTAIRTAATAAPPFKAGSTVQVKVQNLEDRDVYLSCLAITASGQIVILYPANWDVPEDAARIGKRGAPDDTLTIPRPQDETEFPLSGAGSLEILTLVSTKPLRNALKGLQTIAAARNISRGAVDVQGDEPLQMINDLLGDVDEISRGGSRNTAEIQPRSTGRGRILDTGAIAAFSTVIEVVE